MLRANFDFEAFRISLRMARQVVHQVGWVGAIGEVINQHPSLQVGRKHAHFADGPVIEVEAGGDLRAAIEESDESAKPGLSELDAGVELAGILRQNKLDARALSSSRRYGQLFGAGNRGVLEQEHGAGAGFGFRRSSLEVGEDQYGDILAGQQAFDSWFFPQRVAAVDAV